MQSNSEANSKKFERAYENDNSLRENLQEYLKHNVDCVAVVVQPTGEIGDIITQNDAIFGYLSGLRDGRAMTPRSWLYDDQSGNPKSPEQCLQEVISIVENTKINSEFSDEIKQFILSYREKYGPQGGVPPIAETTDTILKGFNRNAVDDSVFEDPLWIRARQILITKLELRKACKPWSYQRAYEHKRNKGRLSRYAGFPTGGKKSEVANYNQAVRDIENGKCWTYPAMVLFRFYRGKLRMVWMYPMALDLLGTTYEAAFMEHIRKLGLPQFSPYEGFETVKISVTNLWRPGENMVFGGDTTAMDDHFWPQMSYQAYLVIRELFEERYWPELERLMMHENEIPLLVAPTVMITGTHGEASGGTFTSLKETIYQSQIQEYIKLLQSDLEDYMLIGDDYIDFLSRLQKWADLFMKWYNHFGLPGKLEKQSDELYTFTFLQRLFVKGWKARGNSKIVGAIYSLISALRSLIWPENWIDPADYPGHFSDMFVTKVAMIVENTVDSPGFEEFAKWVARGQKDIIPFAKKSSKWIDNVWKKSKSVRGIGESYNQEKQDKPLSSYACIAIWRKM